jgi:hypothetical protein
MDLDHVRLRLDAWAIWLAQAGTVGSGYPRINLLAKERGRSASTDYVPISALDAEQTHRAVLRVRTDADHQGYWLAMVCRYAGDPDAPPNRRRPMLLPEIAFKLAVSERSVRSWIVEGERLVALALVTNESATRRFGTR